MPDLDVALRIRADGRGLVGEVRRSRGEIDRLGRTTQQAGRRAARSRLAWERMGRSMEATRRRATGLRLAMASLAAFAGFRVGASFIKAASDAEELRSQFDQVFRELSTEARAWADVQADAVGRSTLDLQQYLATLQDTFVPLGFARRESFELSRTLAQLGIDLASFKNAAEPETIDLLTSAIVGNHEAVRRFGIVITESTLKQELMRRGIEGGVRAATEQQKVLARVAIILRSTADAQGDAARTSDQFANQMRRLRGNVRDLSVEIGEELLPIANDLVTTLNENREGIAQGLRNILEQLRDIGEWAGRNPELAAALLGAGVGARLGGLPGAAVGAVAGAIGGSIAGRPAEGSLEALRRELDGLEEARARIQGMVRIAPETRERLLRINAELTTEVLERIRELERVVALTPGAGAPAAPAASPIAITVAQAPSFRGLGPLEQVIEAEQAGLATLFRTQEELRREQLDRLEDDFHRYVEALRRIEDEEADLAGPFEVARLEARRWVDETRDLLGISADDHGEYADRINDVYRGMLQKILEDEAEARAAAARAAGAGIGGALQDYADQAIGDTDAIRDATFNAFQGMEDALVRFAETGKLEFSDLADSIIADLARIAIQQSITGPLAQGLFGLLGLGGSSTAGFASGGFALFHGGGVAGRGTRFRTGVDRRAFAFAPRYHDGGVAGEIPAFLTRGEGVFTPEQMRALGDAGPREVRVEIVNTGGQPQRVTEARATVDPEAWVIRVVAEDIAGGGQVGRLIEGISPGATL